MNPFVSAQDQQDLEAVAKASAQTAAELEALKKATEGQKELAVKQAGIEYEAIQKAATTKNELDKMLAEAFQQGGLVTLKISAQASSADAPVEMEVNLSNLAVGNYDPLVTHREHIRVQVVSFINQQVQLAHQQLREKDPVSLEVYLQEKKRMAG